MIKNLQDRFVVLIRRPQKILSVAQTTVSLSGPSVNKALDLIATYAALLDRLAVRDRHMII